MAYLIKYHKLVREDLKKLDPGAKPIKTIIVLGQKMLVPGLDKIDFLWYGDGILRCSSLPALIWCTVDRGSGRSPCFYVTSIFLDFYVTVKHIFQLRVELPGGRRRRKSQSEKRTRTMHIGALAQKVGTTTRTVRYYEEMGLVRPEGRTAGGFRRYSMHQVVRAELECSPCFKRKCNSVDCMRNISVDQVLSAVSAVLEIEKSA